MRLRAPAVLAAALLVSGLVGLTGAEASQSKAITSDFRCTQTIFGVDYEPGGPTPAVLTVTAGDAPVGGPLSLDATFVTTAGGVPNGPAALTSLSVTSVLEYTFNNVARTAQSATQAVASVPAFGVLPVATVSDPAVPLTGLAVNQTVDIVPTAFVVNFTSTNAPFAGTVRCVPVKPTTAAAPTGWFENQPFSIASGTGLQVPITGVLGPSPDRCEIPTPADPPCATTQDVEVTVTAGKLVQRAYQGGSNPNSTTIDLGEVTTPLAPTPVPGVLNPITVTDNRGGGYGWTLSATLSSFSGVGSNTIANTRLKASPTCGPATPGEAYDYDASGPSVVLGYNPASTAPGAVAGGTQTFGGTVTLCTKDGQVNSTSQSTGGIYTVTAPLTLTVPSFQAADAYTATMTITLV